MTQLSAIMEEHYAVIGVLRESEKIVIHRLRHKTLGRDLVQLSFEGDAAIYRFLQKINHPHLPRVFAVTEHEGRCIVLEEFIDGSTVADMLCADRYTERGVRKVMSAVCDAVGTLHAQGFVHRDIKPENVMITTKGRVVLLDFDTVRRHKTNATGDTRVIGTAGYAAPEQFGITQTDHRADIYAMGIMMNVMLTGEHPTKTLASGRLRPVIDKCTRLDPNQRYRSVEELKRALRLK